MEHVLIKNYKSNLSKIAVISLAICDVYFSGFNKVFACKETSYVKGNAQVIFLCNSKKSSVNDCLVEILKSTVTKKVTVFLYNLGEENLYKQQLF